MREESNDAKAEQKSKDATTGPAMPLSSGQNKGGGGRADDTAIPMLVSEPAAQGTVSCNSLLQCFVVVRVCVRDGEPRTATSTFTQVFSSVVGWLVLMLPYVHRNHQAHVFLLLKCCFTSTETIYNIILSLSLSVMDY